MSIKRIDITAHLPRREAEFREFCRELSQQLKKGAFDSREEFLLERRQKFRTDQVKAYSDEKLALVFVQSLTIDLLLQDWRLVITRTNIFLEYESADESGLAVSQEKERVRNRHLLARNSQLKEKAVRDFIERMERRRLTDKGWQSIFSLMRDGRELADKLLEARTISDNQAKLNALSTSVKPYIQFAEPEVRCVHTGMLLTEIWRYFRHTWINEYKTLPGRSISILIRDAAAPNHPVIAIAALGSSVAQQGVRDEWIGWESTAFAERIASNPTSEDAKWMMENLQELLNDVYMDDLISEGLFTRKQLKQPTEDLIKKLQTAAGKDRERHVNYPHKSKFSSSEDKPNWKERAKAYLFKSKRCLLIADVLQVLFVFQKNGFDEATKKKLEIAAQVPAVKQVISKLIRRVKARRVGIDMMDIIVCGSVAPYNHILGGKLVCMLLTSPEIVNYYGEKYGDRASLIASSMKGKKVVRKPNLVLLGTTSLYGIGSSQYNRIKIPAQEIGGTPGEVCEYYDLGTSEGFGSFHFSSETLTFANTLVGRRNGGKRVNSIFGEGANPLIRKIREAFELVRLPSEAILMHGNKRVVYGIALASNFREILMGFDKRPKYFFPLAKPKEKTKLIAEYWAKRWLVNRINSDEVIAAVRSHTLSYPITHGARIPQINKRNDLFSNIE